MLTGLPAFLLALVFTAPLPAQNGTYESRAPLTTSRFVFGCASDGARVYSFGGHGAVFDLVRSNEAYDPVTDSWTSFAPMPTWRRDFPAVFHGGLIYTVCGNVGIEWNALEAYDPTTDTWTVLPSAPTMRRNVGAAASGTRLYVTGGVGIGGVYLDTVEAYDTNAGTWTGLAPMPVPRVAHAFVEIGGLIYAVGGLNATGPLASMDAFDPATGTWTPRTPMSRARYSMGAAVVQGFLFVFGGNDASPTPLTEAEVYDPVTDTWTSIPSLPQARSAFGAAALGDRIHLVGGHDGATAMSRHDAYLPTFFRMEPITPGSGNAVNLFAAIGATPERNVQFWWSTRPGSTPLSSCPGLTLGLAAARFLTQVAADTNGEAAVPIYIPPAATGRTGRFQALDEDTCRTTAVLAHTFL